MVVVLLIMTAVSPLFVAGGTQINIKKDMFLLPHQEIPIDPPLLSGFALGSLYMNDCGEPNCGFEYCGSFYANLTLHDSIGTLTIELEIGLGDPLLQHVYAVELLEYTPQIIRMNIDGEEVTLEWVANDTVWDTWHNYYIASHIEDNPEERGGIGSISPDIFPGLASWYYVELRLPRLSSYTITELDILDNNTENVSYAYGINNYGKAGGRSGVDYGLTDVVLWEHQYQAYPMVALWGLWSCAKDVNDMGSIVGSAHNRLGAVHALVWRYGDVKIDLTALGGFSCVSYGYDINNNGEAVGTSYLEPNQWEPPHAFVWSDTNGNIGADPGELIDLGTLPGDDASVAYAINDLSQIVGTSSHTTNDATYSSAFLWTADEGMIGLAPLSNNTNSYAYDINNHGQIVGYSHGPDSGYHTVIWEDELVQELPSLGGVKTMARAINDEHMIVGSSTVSDRGSQHACLWVLNEVWDLNDLIPDDSGWELKEAYDINNRGQIVGYGVNPDGKVRGFVLTPDDGFVIEPKYTFITSYRDGGGIYPLSLISGDLFNGNVSLSVDAPEELHASLFSEVVNTSCPVTDVTIHPDNTTMDGEYMITVEADHGQDSQQVSLMVNISEWGTGSTEYPLSKLEEFLPWLEQNHPEVGNLSAENWWIYRTYTHIWIVTHWTFLSDNWEVRLQIHETIPPYNWTKLWIRPRNGLNPLFAAQHEYNGTIFEIPIEEFGKKYGY